MKLPIYNIILKNAEGLTKMSLVEYPAVESDFLAFDKKEPLKFSLDEEQRIVFGCALRANFPIYRENPDMGAYYVVFSPEVIKQLYEKFMKEGKTDLVNLEHTEDTNGVYLIQSFIKNTNAGLSPKGFDDVDDGSWFCAYKVENDDVWQSVKNGKFNGFSVEAFLELKATNETIEESDEFAEMLNEIDKIINEK